MQSRKINTLTLGGVSWGKKSVKSVFYYFKRVRSSEPLRIPFEIVIFFFQKSFNLSVNTKAKKRGLNNRRPNYVTSVPFVLGIGFHVTTAPRKFPKTCCCNAIINMVVSSFVAILIPCSILNLKQLSDTI